MKVNNINKFKYTNPTCSTGTAPPASAPSVRAPLLSSISSTQAKWVPLTRFAALALLLQHLRLLNLCHSLSTSRTHKQNGYHSPNLQYWHCSSSFCAFCSCATPYQHLKHTSKMGTTHSTCSIGTAPPASAPSELVPLGVCAPLPQIAPGSLVFGVTRTAGWESVSRRVDVSTHTFCRALRKS
jgi:hypothetical protein